MGTRAAIHPLLRLALIGGLAIASTSAGCSRADDVTAAADDGDVQLGVATSAITQGDIVRVALTITGANIKGSITQDLSKSGTVWQGVVGHIPVGTDTRFHADAYDQYNVIQYTGEAQDVVITKNNTTVVNIMLQQVGKPPPFDNVAPIIDALSASATTLPPRNQPIPNGADQTALLAVNAHDPNVGDVLSYQWTSTCPDAIFDSPNSATTVWTPPTVEGTCNVTVRVSDQKNASATATFAIVVSSAAGRGSAIINATLNTWPIIDGLTAEPSIIAPGQTTQVTLAVHDPDDDKLSFKWSTDCFGSFSDTSAQSPGFTLAELSPTGTCTLTVAIDDGRGGTNTGTFGIHTGSVTAPNLAPVVDSAFQSSTGFVESSAVGFHVTAHDPEAQGLSFAWAVSPSGFGSFGAAVDTSTDSTITWTAPASFAQGAAAQITCTITDAQGESTTQTFDLSGTVTQQCTPGQGQPDQVSLDLTTPVSFKLGSSDQIEQTFVVGRSGMLTGIEAGLGFCGMPGFGPTGQLELLLIDPATQATIATGTLDAAQVPIRCGTPQLDAGMIDPHEVFTFDQCVSLVQGRPLEYLIQWRGTPGNVCIPMGTSMECSQTLTACTSSADCAQYTITVGADKAGPYANGSATYDGSPFTTADFAFRTIMQ